MSIRVVDYKGKYWAVIVVSPKVKNKSGKLFQKVGPGEEGRIKAEKLAEAFRRTYGGAGRSPLQPYPLKQAFAEYFETHGGGLKHSTEQTWRGVVKNHLLPRLGEDRDLRTIKKQDLLRFANELAASGKSPAVVKNCMTAFRRMVTAAIEEGLQMENPAKRIGEHVRKLQNRYSHEVRQVDAWTGAEAAKLLELASEYEPRIYLGVLFALHTGARRGEILGLQWKDIDFDRGRAQIRRGRVKARTVTPKTGEGRIVGLSPTLLAELGHVRKKLRSDSPWREELWVFPTKRGKPMQEKTFRAAWLRLKARFQPAGIRPLVFHCTRHTFATLALEAGKSVKWVAEMLGHADPSITLRIYAHAIPSAETDLSFLPGAEQHKRPARTLEKKRDSV